MAMSVNPILPNKQTFKLIGGNSSFLRNGFAMKNNSAKRKSAVELLQESKAYYVKSEKVLDSKQEFKHSEHLQVSANPSFDLLHIKVPTTLKSVPPSSSSSTTTVATDSPKQPPLPPPRKAKLLEQKLLGLHNEKSPHLPPHLRSNGQQQQQQQQQQMQIHLQQQHQQHQQQQQQVLAPKSPRLPRPRSKTQPESAFFSKGEHRKSHPERETSNDIQMKLRRLLNTDSKENLNGNIASFDLINGVPYSTDNENDCLKSYLDIIDTSPKSFCTRGDPILQPRHQQDGNYSIHKSMPDLSPTKLGMRKTVRGRPRTTCSSRGSTPSDSDSDTSGSMSVTAPKSTELQRVHSRATSDYVSRSPSCKCEYLSGGGGGSGKSQCSTRRQTEEDKCSPLITSAGKKGHPYLPLSSSTLSVDDNMPVDECNNGGVRRRPILRSKSDISHRFTRSTTTEFIDSGSSSKINTRTGSDLERFFNCMGLESSVLKVLRSPPSNASSPIFFASTSSVTSSHRDRNSSVGSDGSPVALALRSSPVTSRHIPNGRHLSSGLTNKDLLQHGPLETSIVERNARVIKWLYNCRKANVEGNS